MAEVAHAFVSFGYRLPMRELGCANVNGESFGGGDVSRRSKPAPVRPKNNTSGRRQVSHFRIEMALLTSCPFAAPAKYINSPIGSRGSKWPTFSQELRPRAQQAGAPTAEKLLAA
jgi:hypothetical protein